MTDKVEDTYRVAAAVAVARTVATVYQTLIESGVPADVAERLTLAWIAQATAAE